MKYFILKYTDEEGLTTYHTFNEGFSFSIIEGDMIYTLQFFDPALDNKCVLSADIYVEPGNPYISIAIMQEQELFMLETLGKVEEIVKSAIDEHIESGNAIFDLNDLCNDIDVEMDVFAEEYAQDHLNGLPEKIQEAFVNRGNTSQPKDEEKPASEDKS